MDVLCNGKFYFVVYYIKVKYLLLVNENIFEVNFLKENLMVKVFMDGEFNLFL